MHHRRGGDGFHPNGGRPPSRSTTCGLALLLIAVLCTVGTVANGQNLVADYRLQNSLASSVGSPPPLEFLGASSYTNETVDGLNRIVVVFPAGDGLALTNASQLFSNRYSVVMLFHFDTINRWNRIIDFKNRTTD